MEHTIEALQRTAAFAGLSSDTLRFLFERGKKVQVPAGHVFFRENDHGDCFYLLEQGRVAIYKERGAVRRDVGTLGEGECFGEMALLSVTSRSATVEALEPCTCFVLRNRALFELYEADVGQFAFVMMNLGREVCRRLRDLNDILMGQLVARADATQGRPNDTG